MFHFFNRTDQNQGAKIRSRYFISNPFRVPSLYRLTPYVARNLFQPVSLAYAFRFHDTAVKRLNRYNNNNK